MTTDEVRDGVELTNLDQPLFDGADATKRDLIDYLDAMSDRLVAQLRDRPLSVMRVRPGQQPFMQKNLPKYAPDWLQTTSHWAEKSKREITYALCNDRQTLFWFGNQRAVEYHVPLFRVGGEPHPDYLVMDIDPPEGEPFAKAAAAAHLVRETLDAAQLSAAVKTSGAKGLHIFVPIVATPIEDVAAATRAIAARAERLDPSIATTAFVRDEREGKIFLDSTRAGGATVVSAYSPRLRPGASVSFPVTWEALDDVTPADHTIRNVAALLGDTDPWSMSLPASQQIPVDLVEEGRTIPIARVQAMHAGLRRANETRADEQRARERRRT